MKRKTINQRLAYKLDRETKLQIAAEWADKKAQEVQQIKDRLEYAWRSQDAQEFQLALDALLDLKLRSFPAVKGIAKHLIFGEYKD